MFYYYYLGLVKTAEYFATSRMSDKEDLTIEF